MSNGTKMGQTWQILSKFTQHTSCKCLRISLVKGMPFFQMYLLYGRVKKTTRKRRTEAVPFERRTRPISYIT